MEKLPPADRLNVISFTEECGILSAEELAIIASDVETLLASLAKGEKSCLVVTTAYCKAAAVAHQVTNCLTESFFYDALERAKELDATFAKTGKPTGILFGLPISLKDQFAIAGKGEGVLSSSMDGWLTVLQNVTWASPPGLAKSAKRTLFSLTFYLMQVPCEFSGVVQTLRRLIGLL